MATVNKVVQIFVKLILAEEDHEHRWFDIYVDSLPSDNAETFSRMLKLYDCIGETQCRHTFVCLDKKDHGLSQEENNEMYEELFKMAAYEAYSPPPDVPFVVVGRYYVECDIYSCPDQGKKCSPANSVK